MAENPCQVHDFQATVIHLLGIDHERWTYHLALCQWSFDLNSGIPSLLQRVGCDCCIECAQRENSHPAFGTPLPVSKAKGQGGRSIVDCVVTIEYGGVNETIRKLFSRETNLAIERVKTFVFDDVEPSLDDSVKQTHGRFVGRDSSRIKRNKKTAPERI